MTPGGHADGRANSRRPGDDYRPPHHHSPGGFRRSPTPAVAKIALPDAEASLVQIRRLHACARDVGLDHDALKAMAAAVGYEGSLRDLPSSSGAA